MTDKRTTRRVKPPPMQGKKKKPPTLERLLSDVRKGFNMQLNTFTAQFLDVHNDAEIDAFLPENVSDADAWIESLVNAFLDNEEPTTDEMVDAIAAIFVMAFLERLYEACGITADDEDEDEDEDDEEGEEGDEDTYQED